MEWLETTAHVSKYKPPVKIDLLGPLPLTGHIQHYTWGKPAKRSIVAKFAGSEPNEEPCAELWFGTHPKGTATVVCGELRCDLGALIAQYPDAVLGQSVITRFGPSLPFLFKVLSINEALSIQAHPSKVSNPHGNDPSVPEEFWSNHAGYLHWKDPANYPDSNHKPEIAIALSALSLIQGFKPVDSLRAFLAQTPELAALVRPDNVSRLEVCGTDSAHARAVVRDMYSAVLLSTPEERAVQMGAFEKRLRSGVSGLSWEREHLEKMFATYGPGDVGIPTALLMNWTRVPPGSAVYMGPNELHAYLEGDVVECMANSDNVVRAGLTRKFQDTDEILSMIDVRPENTRIIEPIPCGQSNVASVYQTPADEFKIFRIAGAPGASERFSNQNISLVLCVSGTLELESNACTLMLQEGHAALVPAAAGVFSITSRGGNGFLATVPPAN
jgi:mannose-6-phosphate isomerase